MLTCARAEPRFSKWELVGGVEEVDEDKGKLVKKLMAKGRKKILTIDESSVKKYNHNHHIQCGFVHHNEGVDICIDPPLSKQRIQPLKAVRIIDELPG